MSDIVKRLTSSANVFYEWNVDEGALFKDAAAEITRLEAALQNARKDAWQPIETAPKDGTELLLFDWKENSGHWYVGYWGEWDSAGGPVETWIHIGPHQRPTHWQPLPEPPSLTPPTEKAT